MSLYFEEEEAIKILKERGYRVVKVEFPETQSITTIKKLVEFFYARRFFYNKDRKYPASVDFKNDSKFASDLVRSRQKLGLNRKQAIQEAASLIEGLFKFEPFLKLKEPINHLTIVTSRPIMDRICMYLNGESSDVEESLNEDYVNKLNKIYEKQYFDQDFEDAQHKRKHILEKL